LIRTVILSVLSVGGLVGSAAAQLPLPDPMPRTGTEAGLLPPVFFPAENQFSEAKRVLGKMLFWDEQLSSDNTRSCGSCHISSVGGVSPDLVPHPGFDETYGTEDDRFTSKGIIRSLKDGVYKPDALFGLDPQATPRSAPPSIGAAFVGELFWDGRAGGEFIDPETGQSVIPFAGSLESQAVGPVLSSVEMAHEDRDWGEVAAKLARVVPMALARDLPPDVEAALGAGVDYPALFESAFGDGAINAVRIAKAIATYERTLIPDQTPWDRFMSGEKGAMTPEQIAGWNLFNASTCGVCHSAPFFLDFSFHNLGVRPNVEDIGREGVTGRSGDRGEFKTASLRNLGLRRSFMHTGGVFGIDAVFEIYSRPTPPGSPNRSGLLPITFAPFEQAQIAEFLMTALDDPRVASEEFPFDRPALFDEWGRDKITILAGGVAGAGGLVPRVIAATPPNVGHDAFRIGLARALPGAQAFVAVSSEPPSGGVVAPDLLEGPFKVAEGGHATFVKPVLARRALDGRVEYMQWRVEDASAPGGLALSPPVRVEYFCNGRCPDLCPADLAEPFAVLDLSDVQVFAGSFLAGDGLADLAEPFGVLDLADTRAFVISFQMGCQD